jgi:hypothetical protein
MTAPYCPFCQSFRTISTLGPKRRVICLDCKTRWLAGPDDIPLGPSPTAERPVAATHPSVQGRSSSEHGPHAR